MIRITYFYFIISYRIRTNNCLSYSLHSDVVPNVGGLILALAHLSESCDVAIVLIRLAVLPQRVDLLDLVSHRP